MTFFDWSVGTEVTGPDGVSRVSASGQSIQILRVAVSAGNPRPEHHHVNEQAVFVLEGALELTVDGHVHTLGPGEGCIVPSDAPALGAGRRRRGRPAGDLQPPTRGSGLTRHAGLPSWRALTSPGSEARRTPRSTRRDSG